MTLTPPPVIDAGDPHGAAVGRLASSLAAWRTDTRVMEELIARQVHPDLDAGELDLLTWIVNKAPVSPEQLAEMLLLPLSAVEQDIAELDRLDLIRIAAPDAAGTRYVTPRPFAVKLAHSLSSMTTSTLGAAVRDWEVEKITLLTELLDRLIEGYDAVDGEVVDELIRANAEAAAR